MTICRSALLATVFGVAGVAAGGQTAPTAVVRAGVAEFSIPVADTERWRWGRSETADNAGEYRWEVEVTSGADTYSFGFSLFKFTGTQEGAGRLEDLLNAGQASVWRIDRNSGGVIVKEAMVSVSAAAARVIVRVTDPATMRLLFQDRPPTVKVVTRDPDADELSQEVAISYAE